MQKKDGTFCNVEAVITDQRDRPSIGGYVANVRDITERKEFEALLAHQALHDSLTGLANRQLTVDRAEHMLLRARRERGAVALCFIDLDNFKDTNDSLGHEAGDKLLCAVAERLSRMLRAGDTVGRLGGDEFVILTEGASLADGPLLVAERIREALHEPFFLKGYEGLPITVTASVGIATGDRPSAHELLRDADVALYRAKAVGKDCCVLFEPEMQSAAVDRLALKSNLYSALANDQFFLLYQPIFEIDSMAVRGVEALLRWQHPTRGVISPDEFIPVLEENGLILGVGAWVLQQACAQAARWQSQGYLVQMSVNVSMRQVASLGLVNDVVEALETSRVDPDTVTLEVTESVLMRDAEATVAHLCRLKELGVKIAIDDFGSGQSSLTYLRRFPIDELKIDRSFIAAIDGSRESTALLHTLVELGRTLGLSIVAEGIETCSQLEGLRGEHCAYGQGFIFARPMNAAGVEPYLCKARSRGRGRHLDRRRSRRRGRGRLNRTSPPLTRRSPAPPSGCRYHRLGIEHVGHDGANERIGVVGHPAGHAAVNRPGLRLLRRVLLGVVHGVGQVDGKGRGHVGPGLRTGDGHVQGIGVLLPVEPPAAGPHEVVHVVDVERIRGEGEEERRVTHHPQLRVAAHGILHGERRLENLPGIVQVAPVAQLHHGGPGGGDQSAGPRALHTRARCTSPRSSRSGRSTAHCAVPWSGS